MTEGLCRACGRLFPVPETDGQLYFGVADWRRGPRLPTGVCAECAAKGLGAGG